MSAFEWCEEQRLAVQWVYGVCTGREMMYTSQLNAATNLMSKLKKDYAAHQPNVK
jgi:ferredoxin-NADP reductase